MSDKVFPSSKPTTNGTTNTTTTTTAPTTTTNPPTTATNKSHLYNPTSRLPYRPQPHTRRHHNRPRRSARSLCCSCCFWTILLVLLLALLAAIAGAALYLLYHPHRPEFSINSLRISRLNLTTSADSSSSHLSTLFNLTITSKNPNSHLTFFYDPFVVTCFSTNNNVYLGNGSIPAYISDKKNQTSFRTIVSESSNDLDADSVTALRSDLKKKSGVSLEVQMDTKVKVEMGKLKSKKVGIRVTCEGIKGVVPKGKSPSVANTAASKCKVDLRIKIWKWTF